MRMKSMAAVAALTLSVAWAAPAPAQERDAPRPTAVAPAPAPEGGAGPLDVVARFLRLSPEQAQALVRLVQARNATVAPLLQEIARREQLIRELIASGGDPAEIGRLVIEVHHLQELVAAAQGSFLAAVQSLLDEQQRQRWNQVRVAAQLQPLVPAFQALQML